MVTTEWVALAGAVVIGGITAIWFVMNTLNTPANSVAAKVTPCEAYAAQHSGSTKGCT
jgi:hypothetical protein